MKDLRDLDVQPSDLPFINAKFIPQRQPLPSRDPTKGCRQEKLDVCLDCSRISSPQNEDPELSPVGVKTISQPATCRARRVTGEVHRYPPPPSPVVNLCRKGTGEGEGEGEKGRNSDSRKCEQTWLAVWSQIVSAYSQTTAELWNKSVSHGGSIAARISGNTVRGRGVAGAGEEECRGYDWMWKAADGYGQEREAGCDSLCHFPPPISPL